MKYKMPDLFTQTRSRIRTHGEAHPCPFACAQARTSQGERDPTRCERAVNMQEC